MDCFKKRDIISFIFSLLMYCINQAFLKPNTYGAIGYFCRCYFNDLVCPLFFLAATNMMLGLVGNRIQGFRRILVFGLFMSLFWEYIGPLINKNSVSDPIDILFYLIGTGIYWVFCDFNYP